jgi:CheY-like chemotaxis protein
MSKPISFDMTPRAAAEEDDARRAALLSGDLGIDIIVVDDQPDHDWGWFSKHLSGHRRLSLESVHEVERFLAGDRLPNLPDPPYEAELAIVDLSLGSGQPDGLQALDTLRQHRDTRDLPAILNTNGLGDYRDMLAVLAAQLNGGAIPVAQKSGSDGPAVREHARHIAHARQADLPWPLTKAAPKPLLHVQEVIWHGDKSRPVSLLDYLLDLPWKRTYWKEMARHKSHAEAAFEARKRHGSLTDQDDGRKQDYSRAVTKQFGPVAVAWALAGECLHELGGRLSIIDAQLDPRYKEFSSSTGAQLVAFATKYGPVLSSQFVPALLDRLRRPARDEPGT